MNHPRPLRYVLSGVEAAVSACAWAVAGHQHSLCMQVPDVPVYGYVDPVKLRQVVANLDNVCKHTQMLGRVYLVLERVGEEAVLTIAHESASISSSETTIGPDIGLALVRELVQMHGGSIETRSAGAGRGSAFVARLPPWGPATPDTDSLGPDSTAASEKATPRVRQSLEDMHMIRVAIVTGSTRPNRNNEAVAKWVSS